MGKYYKGKAESKKSITKDTATEVKSSVTFLGEGPLSGEYRFAEIAGSIAASSKEEAIAKAEEIAIKHPDLLKK